MFANPVSSDLAIRLAVGVLAAFAFLPVSAGEAGDLEGVRAAIGNYFKGHATGDASHMRKAFLPTAHIEGIRDGQFTSWTLDEYCALFKGEPPADESDRTRTIDLVDVSGSAAIAQATLTQDNAVITDYFVLLKVGDEWRIANKVYSFARPGAAP